MNEDKQNMLDKLYMQNKLNYDDYMALQKMFDSEIERPVYRPKKDVNYITLSSGCMLKIIALLIANVLFTFIKIAIYCNFH